MVIDAIRYMKDTAMERGTAQFRLNGSTVHVTRGIDGRIRFRVGDHVRSQEYIRKYVIQGTR